MAKKRPKQMRILGTEDTPPEALLDAADALEEKRDERQALQAAESELSGKVLDLMQEHNIQEFRLSSDRLCQLVETEPKKKIRLSTPKAKED